VTPSISISQAHTAFCCNDYFIWARDYFFEKSISDRMQGIAFYDGDFSGKLPLTNLHTDGAEDGPHSVTFQPIEHHMFCCLVGLQKQTIVDDARSLGFH